MPTKRNRTPVGFKRPSLVTTLLKCAFRSSANSETSECWLSWALITREGASLAWKNNQTSPLVWLLNRRHWWDGFTMTTVDGFHVVCAWSGFLWSSGTLKFCEVSEWGHKQLYKLPQIGGKVSVMGERGKENTFVTPSVGVQTVQLTFFCCSNPVQIFKSTCLNTIIWFDILFS